MIEWHPGLLTHTFTCVVKKNRGNPVSYPFGYGETVPLGRVGRLLQGTSHGSSVYAPVTGTTLARSVMHA
jgi:hypothetical protein